MSDLRTAEIETALKAKGFVKEKRDHYYFFFHYKGRKTSIHTRFSHNERVADSWLQGQMARQMRLSKADFLAFVACTISATDYAAMMLQRGYVRV